MYRIPGVLSAVTATPKPAVPRAQPAGDSQAAIPEAPGGGDATGPSEAIPGHAEDREGLNDVVVRLFTAGQDLRAALGLMGGHPANGKICRALAELEQAILELRDSICGQAAG